ncbi:MAG: transcriptional repressor [Aestuariivita sp.]|nr:transcriptional repressor [Aestuariivita sp.]MCY4202852.1 transcriptional repressor [Aestuariivita sp.]MCY4288746.1 transcriptional repressor [Aestuariivita sp.]MCY4346687.1 transcriptional repressor [Aestuariivita sp.]
MPKQISPVTHADRVLEILRRHGCPLSAYKILHALSEDGVTAPTTVYRALDNLRATGKAHRIESLNAWITCSKPHHSGAPVFEICDYCHNVTEHLATQLASEIETMSSESGFTPNHFIIEIHGRCSDCKRAGLATGKE